MRLKNKKIFILSPNNWGNMHISKHHYAKELIARGNEVYFFNPPNIKNQFISIKKIEPRLTIINYAPIFRGRSILPSKIYNFLIRLQIKFLYNKIGTKPDILWSFSSTIYYRLDWFDADIKLFQPMDQLNSTLSASIGEYADYIFTVSDYILNELSDIKKPKLLIPHGISPSYVNYNFEYWVKKDSLNICYVGNLFIENLDRNSLKAVIIENKEQHFHFIGAIKPEDSNIAAWENDESINFVEFLLNSPNVTCHGIIPSYNIPAVVSKMDAFLVCYLSNKENVISNSHKILEYLATGRLVISTFIKQYKGSKLLEMIEQENEMSFADFYSEKIKNIDIYNTLELQNNRTEFAKSNSYSAHLDTIEEFILNHKKN